MNSSAGYAEGETCNRDGCDGVIEIHPSDNCSCHISPPCSACTAPRNFCPECGWEESDEEVLHMNDHVVRVDKASGMYTSWTLRPLDGTKVDWHNKSHSHCSMIKEGVYPPGTTMEEVRKLVDGTFGGRFEYFRDGKFKFIAYTD